MTERKKPNCESCDHLTEKGGDKVDKNKHKFRRTLSKTEKVAGESS